MEGFFSATINKVTLDMLPKIREPSGKNVTIKNEKVAKKNVVGRKMSPKMVFGLGTTPKIT